MKPATELRDNRAVQSISFLQAIAMRNRNFPRIPGKASQRGFSLIEIIIVVTLIALIAAFVVNKVAGQNDRAKVRLAESQVLTIAEKVEQYRMDTGELPPTLQALVNQSGGAPGWLGPYAKEGELLDPWKNALQYQVPGESGAFDVVSLGADGKPGGQSVNADIRNP